MATLTATIVADFTTALASELAIGGTSATLASATDDDGVALPSGRYFFTIDGSNSRKEHISCDLSSTALTNIKSVSRQGVETSGTVRKHRIGSSVTITDFSHILQINNLVNGTTDLNASDPLKYDGTATINNDNQLATKSYVDGVAVSGAPDASTTAKGIVEEATQAEVLAKTQAGGTGAELFVNPSTMASTLLSDYKADTGSADAYVITPTPAITAYTVGQRFTYMPANTCTGASTLNVNGLGAKTQKRPTGSDTLGGDIVAGRLVEVEYDGTNFGIISSLPSIDNVATFGNGADGDVTISVNTALTRDMYYNNLTINGGVVLSPSGYRIYVKNTLTNAGTIRRNGNDGTAGLVGIGDGFNTPGGGSGGGGGSSGAPIVIAARNIINTGTIESNGGVGGVGGRGANYTIFGGTSGAAAGGAGATAVTAGTLAGSPAGSAGGNGGNAGGTGIPTAGGAVSSLSNAAGVAGVAGGTGGASNATLGAAGGTAGAITSSKILPNVASWATLMNTIIDNTTAFINSSNSGSGGGGGGATAAGFGGGGGGGGAGGSGGVIALVYSYYKNTGTVQCLGGAAGAGGAAGTGTTPGTAGVAGNAGNTGVIYQVTV